MRATYSSVFLCVILVSIVFLVPNWAKAVSCKKSTEIVYSNGMYNDQRDARMSIDELTVKLIASNTTYGDAQLYKFHLAYANDNGGFSAGLGTGLEQLLEVGRQIFGDKSTDLFWMALTRGTGRILNKALPPPAADLVNAVVPEGPPPAFRKAMQDIALRIDSAAYVNDTDLNRMLNGGNGFDGYRTLLGSGKRVVIVAHSQGNFYANRAYREMTDPLLGGDQALEASIGVIAVATPANVVRGGKLGANEPNITVSEDLVIAPLRATLGSLPVKPADGDWSPNMGELGLWAWANAMIGHSFVEWYLAGRYTRDFILNGIVSTNGKLKYPTLLCTQKPVPWEKTIVHDWSSYKTSSGMYRRRIRDDKNELQFDARWDPYSGYISLSVDSVDGEVSSRIDSYHFSEKIPQAIIGQVGSNCKFLGFVPIPSGVGVLFRSLHMSRYFPNGVSGDGGIRNNSFGEDEVVLISHYWNKGVLNSDVKRRGLPPYNAYSYVVNGGSGSIVSGKSSLYYQQIATRKYRFDGSYYYSDYPGPRFGTTVYQSDTYISWTLMVGELVDNMGNFSVPWCVVKVDDGVLVLYSGSLPVSESTSIKSVVIGGVYAPYGRYSSILALFDQYNAYYIADPVLHHLPYYIEMGLPTPIQVNSISGVEMLDQLVLRGDDAPVKGMSVKTAPGYTEKRFFAAASQEGLFNARGRLHPSRPGRIPGQGVVPIAQTPADEMFFRW